MGAQIIVRGKPHKPTSSSREMTENELASAEWRIEVTAPGEYIINDIYGKEVWDAQPCPGDFGGVFRKAVLDKRLKNIRIKIENGIEILSGDGQVLYIVNNPGG